MQSQQNIIILKESNDQYAYQNEDADDEEDLCFRRSLLRKKSSSMDNLQIDEKIDAEVMCLQNNNYKEKSEKKEGKLKNQIELKKLQNRLRLKSQLQLANKIMISQQIKKTTIGFLNKYELFEKLGQGSSSVVKLCKRKEHSKMYAVKIMSFNGPDELFNKINEWLIQSTLKHKNIVRSHDFYIEKDQNTAYLVMDMVQGKTIQEWLSERKIFSENEARIIMKGIIKAIHYMHFKNICHRDINNYNVFYEQKKKQVTIIDFSISKIVPKEYSKLWTNTGTLFFKAPEIFGNYPYDKQVDIWGAGVILYNMVTGQLPFLDPEKRVTNLIHLIQHKQVTFEQPTHLSIQLIDLITQMLDKNPKTRITSKQILDHPWMKIKTNVFDNDYQHTKLIPKPTNKKLTSPNVYNSTNDLYFCDNFEQQLNYIRDCKFRHVSIDDLNQL